MARANHPGRAREHERVSSSPTTATRWPLRPAPESGREAPDDRLAFARKACLDLGGDFGQAGFAQPMGYAVFAPVHHAAAPGAEHGRLFFTHEHLSAVTGTDSCVV